MVLDKRKIITSDFNIPPGMIDLGIGQPGMSLLPLAALAQAAEHCLSQNNPYILAYGAEQGNWYFRSALPGSNFSPRRDLKNYMRFSFAYYEESDLIEAAKRIAAVIR